MIINAQESNIQVIGDITEFKSSIDPKNLEFITTLLSSNLYSAPERSFIREIVSNAWDAQVEAGTTNIPIIIKITENITNKNSYYESSTGFGDITIRDFGTGLSPERFNDIYRNIGSSTKRESNDYHGAFGIGHLSGFSCSNTMYVTSYYNGTCYEYIGIKDANTIVYTLVSTTPTTEKSGLEVTLKNVYLEKYRKSLKYIMFFPNVYIDDNNPYHYNVDINNVKIKKYTNFWVSSNIIRDKILLGNVLYPLNFNELNLKVNSALDKFHENIKSTGIVLKFDIGELSVTPNRENIIYTKDCIAKITNKIEAAYKEITDIIEDNLKEDYTDIIYYAKLIQNDKGFDFFENKLTRFNYGDYLIPKSQVMHIKYKGKDISMYKDLFWYLTENISYCSKCMICGSSVYNITSDIKSVPYKYKSRLNLTYIDANVGNNDIKLVILKEDIKLSKYIKEYLININLNSESNDIIVLYPLDLDTIKDSILLAARLDAYNDTGIIDFIIQEVIDYIYSKGTVIDFNNDADFLKFKESRKEENKLNRKKSSINYKDVIINVYNFSYCAARKHTFSNLDKAVKFLEGCHKGIVTIDRDTPDSSKDIILSRGFLPIFVNKKIREILKEYSFNIELSWVLNDDPYLSYYKTILETFKEEISLTSRLQALGKVISSNYLEDINSVLKVKLFEDKCPSYKRQAELCGKTDESLKNRMLKIKEFLKKYDEALDILEDSGVKIDYYNIIQDCKYRSLLGKVLVKNKSFIVNPSVYRSIKKNKLINILCKK